MESLAYIITNKFVIVAFDGNIELTNGESDFKFRHIKKAYKTGDSTIVSIVGNLHKMTKLYRYILELCKLNKNITPSQLLADIKDLIPKGVEEITVAMKQIYEMLESAKEDDITDIEREILIQKIENHETLKELAGGSELTQPKKNLNYVFIFNHNPDDGICSIGACIAGSFVIDSPLINKDNIPKNQFFIGIVSSLEDENEMIQLRQRYVEELKPLFEKESWEDSPTKTEMIDGCKKILEKALVEITPFDDAPEVFFYELGEHTDYKVSIPETHLSEFNVKGKD